MLICLLKKLNNINRIVGLLILGFFFFFLYLYLLYFSWSGGVYGVGKRMNLMVTRKIIDAIHRGDLDNFSYYNLPIFNLKVPT